MLLNLRKFAGRIHKDETGAMSVEKVMIIALISLPIIIALWLFRKKLVGWFNEKANSLSDD